MKMKLVAAAMLALLFGAMATRVDANICVPIVPAPAMRECPEASVVDLGTWDDAFRFEDLDSVFLRRGDKLFSYSPVTGNLKQFRIVAGMANSRVVNTKIWGKHQWVFCDRGTVLPIAVDLGSRQNVVFECAGEGEKSIGEVFNSGGGPGTIVRTSGGSFWMDLESGKVIKLNPGGALEYFSADQKLAVFEGKSTNAWMYAPWVVVDMATGQVTNTLPDQTKGLWSETVTKNLDEDGAQLVWQLRTARTPVLQPGRGHADDKFGGLCLNGVPYVILIPDTFILIEPNVPPLLNNTRCNDAWINGNLAAFSLSSDGIGGDYYPLWVAQLEGRSEPVLLETNTWFNNKCELLGGRRCVFLSQVNPTNAETDAMVFDIESKTAWNVLDAAPLLSMVQNSFLQKNGAAHSGYSGIGPSLSIRFVPGFGSAHYQDCVLCLYSAYIIPPDNMRPIEGKRMAALVTADGNRYEINFPADLTDDLKFSVFSGRSWLHKSGKLLVCGNVQPFKEQGRRHVFAFDLHVPRP